MKKFFQNKRNIAIVVSAAVVLIVAVAGIVVAVTAEKNQAAYEPIEADSLSVSQVETLSVSETETEPTTEPITEPTTVKPVSNTAETAKKNTEDTNHDTGKSSSGEGSKTPVIDLPKTGNLIGNWRANDSIAPSELLSDEFLSITGFNTDMQIAIIYRFSADKSFSIEYYIENYQGYADALRDAYAIYIKAINPDISPEDFEHDVGQSASYTMHELCQAAIGCEWGANMSCIFGSYSYDSNTIWYQCDGTSFSETYMLDGDTLKLTGSSFGNEGYPITLKRI